MKLTKFLLIAGAAMCLASCDGLGGLFGPGGGEEEGEFNPNLYTLQLKVNLQGEEFQDLGIEYTAMDEEEMDFLVSEYGSKGLTKENLEKVGTFENGKYYFMEQDGFYLKAPLVVGYKLDGWYDGNTRIDGGIDYDCDGKTDYLVNMPAKNTILEARYSPIEFTFRMSAETDGHLVSNPQQKWKITDGDLDLSQFVDDDESKNLKQWNLRGNYFKHSEGIVNVNQGETPDPRSSIVIENITKIDKDLIKKLGDVAYGYCSEIEMDITGIYEIKECDVTISWTYGVDASFYIMIASQGSAYRDALDNHWFETNFNDGTIGETYSKTLSLKWGDTIKIYYNLADLNYTFDGYYNGNTCLDRGNEYILQVKDDTNIDIKLTYNPLVE